MGEITVGKGRISVAASALALTALAACVSTSTVGYRDVPELPPHFVGAGYRAWIEGNVIAVEVEQEPGVNVVAIDHVVEGDAIHLSPRRISGGGDGRDVFRIHPAPESLTAGWQDRVYWLTGEGVYLPFHWPFWSKEARQPTERVRVEFVDAPYLPPAG